MKLKSMRLASVSAGILLSLAGGLISAAPSMATSAPVESTPIVSESGQSDAFAKKTFDLMNAERAKVGSPRLLWNQRIADVSQDWANKLGVATKDPNFDWNKIHRADAGGSLIPSGATMYREIIGFNFTPEQIVDWWMNSPGHKDAMLHSKATDAGIGYVVPTSGPYAGWHLVVSNLAGYPGSVAPPSPTISYAGHVQNVGWQSNVGSGGTAGTIGQGLRLEALQFNSAGQAARAHVQNIGWQDYRSGPSTIGTNGQSLRMEAIQVKSTVAGQAILCQAHVENVGWMPEVGDGQVCGTEGRALRLEAVRLRVVTQ